MQQSNKATREDCPSVAGEELFEIFQKAATDFFTFHRSSSRESAAVIATSAGGCDASRRTTTCFTQDVPPLHFSMGTQEHQTAAFPAQWSFGVLDLPT